MSKVGCQTARIPWFTKYLALMFEAWLLSSPGCWLDCYSCFLGHQAQVKVEGLDVCTTCLTQKPQTNARTNTHREADTRAHTHTHSRAHVCVCMYVYIYIYIYIYIYLFIYLFIYIYLFLFICVCTYIYIYICLFM